MLNSKLKRLFSVLMVLVMLALVFPAVVACSDDDEEDPGPPIVEPWDEPELRNGLEWHENLPWSVFPERAETIYLVPLMNPYADINITVQSLMAQVNSVEPRIGIAENRDTTVFQQLDIDYYLLDDPFEVFHIFSDYIRGVVIYDTASPHTINLACTLAGIEGVLAASFMVYATLAAQGIDMPIVADYRGQFIVPDRDPDVERHMVYEYMFENIYARAARRTFVSLNPASTLTLRDYAMAVGAAITWLDFAPQHMDFPLLSKFLERTALGNASLLGWSPRGDEGSLINAASTNGMFVWPSDHSRNITVLAARRPEGVEPVQLRPANVDEFINPMTGEVIPYVYVAVGMADGDNLQYMKGHMLVLWNHHQRHDPYLPPISWTVSPAAVELLPVLHDYFFRDVNEGPWQRDSFLTGPSGIGYFYPFQMYNYLNVQTATVIANANAIPSDEITPEEREALIEEGIARAEQRAPLIRDAMMRFYDLTNRYCRMAGITAISTWYQGVGDPWVPDSFLDLISPRLPNIDLMLFQGHNRIHANPSTARPRGGMMFKGWDDPYNEGQPGNTSMAAHPQAHFYSLIGGAFRAFAPVYANSPQNASPEFVTVQAVPWTDNVLYRMASVRRASYNLNAEGISGRDVIRFITMDQMAMLLRISEGLPATQTANM